MSDKEKKVFSQELNRADLKAVGGGIREDDKNNCVQYEKRNIYAGGFPNCAATVGDGSRCIFNDACSSLSVKYGESLKDDCILADCNVAWH